MQIGDSERERRAEACEGQQLSQQERVACSVSSSECRVRERARRIGAERGALICAASRPTAHRPALPPAIN